MKSNLLYNHFKLHVVVVIYGFTAIFGKLINLPAHQLVWYRMLIAAISLFALFKISRTNYFLPRKELIKILATGLIVAAHWISFFGAIKLSNVSVTLVCLASATLFTSVLEPLFYKKRLSALEVLIGTFIIIGIYLIFQFETHYWEGIITALFSAFLAALFAVINRKFVAKHRARVISFYEMIGGFLGISVYLLFTNGFTEELYQIHPSDFIYLLILGILCTAFAFVIQVDVMKKLTAYIVSLAINLEPVYGILLAFLFFGNDELMSSGFYFGSVIILVSVFGYPIYKHYFIDKKEV